MEKEAPYFAKMIPQWPRLITQALEHAAAPPDQSALKRIVEEQRRTNQRLIWMGVVLAALVAWEVWRFV